MNDTEASSKDLTALTWNIESAKKNIFFLKDILEARLPSLVFLSEPQAFQADINHIMDYVRGDYCHFLNSEDLHNPDLPLVTNHAVGGTLCLWRRSLDPFVTIYPATNSSFTPLILRIPNYQTSIHIGIYSWKRC